MSFQAIVPLVLAKDQTGHVAYYYEGAVIPWLSDVDAGRLLAEKAVVKVGDVVDDADQAEAPPASASDAAAKLSPPKKTALQSEWAKYAIEQHGANPDEANAATRQDLIELYGG